MARALISDNGTGDDIVPVAMTTQQQKTLASNNAAWLQQGFGIDVTAPGFDGGAAANQIALTQADRLRPSSGLARDFDWIANNLFQVFVTVGSLGSAYVASGAGAASSGANAVSGVDLAADAAIGTGNNITTAAQVFGSGGSVAAPVAVDTFSGVDLAADAPIGTGNNITTAAEAFGGAPTIPNVTNVSTPDIANTGSDAHLYQPGGPTLDGLSPLANTGGSITPTLSWSAAADSIAGSAPVASTAPAEWKLPSLSTIASGASTLAGLVKAGEQLYNGVVGQPNGNGGNPQSRPATAQARSLWPVLAIVGGLFFALKG